MTVAEAAALWKCSPDTVRRRARLGQVTARQRPTANGYAWEVARPADAPLPGDAPSDAGQVPDTLHGPQWPQDAPAGPLVTLAERIDHLDGENRYELRQVRAEVQQLRWMTIGLALLLVATLIAVVVLLAR